jgi:glycosyltransferase involved in cell wall biosynthesis
VSRRHVVQVVRSDAFAGVERYIVDVATELHRRGWQVTVIGGDEGAMRAELPGNVIHRRAASVTEVAGALRRVGRRDVMHAHMTAAELPAAALKGRARLVVTRHFATPRGRSAPGRLAARFIERRLDAQIAISRFVADATDSPCIVVHNGVRPSERSLPRERVVLVLQRLEPEKDTATALRSWAASALADAGWHLRIHGRGSQEGELRALAGELGVEGSVDFAGFTDDPRSALARAGLLLATAAAEPFGLAVVEGMAEGTPVVATDSGAHRETLGEHGTYFAPGDVAAGGAALRALANDPDRRSRLGAAVRERQRAEFSISVHVDRLESLYEPARVRS